MSRAFLNFFALWPTNHKNQLQVVSILDTGFTLMCGDVVVVRSRGPPPPRTVRAVCYFLFCGLLVRLLLPPPWAPTLLLLRTLYLFKYTRNWKERKPKPSFKGVLFWEEMQIPFLPHHLLSVLGEHLQLVWSWAGDETSRMRVGNIKDYYVNKHDCVLMYGQKIYQVLKNLTWGLWLPGRPFVCFVVLVFLIKWK